MQDLKRRYWPSWLAPIFGIAVGCYGYLSVCGKMKTEPTPSGFVFASVFGALGGGVVVYLDVWKRRRMRMQQICPATRGDRIVAVFSDAGTVLPLIGIAIGIIAVIRTRRTSEWPQPVSMIGLVGAIFFTVLIFSSPFLGNLFPDL